MADPSKLSYTTAAHKNNAMPCLDTGCPALCCMNAPSEPHLAAHSPVKDAVENVLQEGNSYHLSPLTAHLQITLLLLFSYPCGNSKSQGLRRCFSSSPIPSVILIKLSCISLLQAEFVLQTCHIWP